MYRKTNHIYVLSRLITDANRFNEWAKRNAAKEHRIIALKFLKATLYTATEIAPNIHIPPHLTALVPPHAPPKPIFTEEMAFNQGYDEANQVLATVDTEDEFQARNPFDDNRTFYEAYQRGWGKRFSEIVHPAVTAANSTE